MQGEKGQALGRWGRTRETSLTFLELPLSPLALHCPPLPSGNNPLGGGGLLPDVFANVLMFAAILQELYLPTK